MINRKEIGNKTDIRRAVVSLAQNDFVRLMAPASAILLMWLLIAAKKFSFHYTSNELDVLPYAKQFFEGNWLPNDWYLNLDIGYRRPFNFIIGGLISWLGFQDGAYVGRLSIYLILAIALYTFFREFRLRFWLGLLALLFFLDHQSLIAGEWIVSGVDTKTISYACVFLSCASFYRKRYLAGFAFAGAAMSFHVLVGLYAMFCIAFAVLLSETWRSEWRTYISQSWPFFITGIFSLQTLIEQTLPQNDVNLSKAWELYVQYRVPHHVLPTTWVGYNWIAILALATCLFIISYFIKQSRGSRFIAAYALGSVALFLFGLVIYAWGEITLLRFYWFRFPDVIVPFMSAVLVGLVLNDYADGRLSIPSLPYRFQYRMRAILNYGVPIIATIAAIIIIPKSMVQLQSEYKGLDEVASAKDTRFVFRWIAENTPKQAVFLIDPTISDFYIYAQRAMFVSFKHSPHSAADILEWHERIQLCNGNRTPDKSGFSSQKEIQSNFYRLDEEQIRQIARLKGINYYLGLSQQRLTFERVYSDFYFTVYKVNEVDIAND